jgi:hypothetical protein
LYSKGPVSMSLTSGPSSQDSSVWPLEKTIGCAEPFARGMWLERRTQCTLYCEQYFGSTHTGLSPADGGLFASVATSKKITASCFYDLPLRPAVGDDLAGGEARDWSGGLSVFLYSKGASLNVPHFRPKFSGLVSVALREDNWVCGALCSRHVAGAEDSVRFIRRASTVRRCCVGNAF